MRVRSWAITIAMALFIGIAGMFTYRLGAAYNLPYGLFVTLAAVGMSCFAAGVYGGVWQQFAHACVSTAAVWAMALMSSSSSTVVAMGGAALTTLWSQKASIVWLYGIIVVQVIVTLLPKKWYDAFKE